MCWSAWIGWQDTRPRMIPLVNQLNVSATKGKGVTTRKNKIGDILENIITTNIIGETRRDANYTLFK